jgi:hypothetical protein
VQHPAQQHADRLGPVDQPVQAGIGQDRLRVAQVTGQRDHIRGLGQQCFGVGQLCSRTEREVRLIKGGGH